MTHADGGVLRSTVHRSVWECVAGLPLGASAVLPLSRRTLRCTPRSLSGGPDPGLAHPCVPTPAVYPDGRVCISILHAPGDDPMGYESSAERWSPVQSVEKILLSVVSMLAGNGARPRRAHPRGGRGQWGCAASVTHPCLRASVLLVCGDACTCLSASYTFPRIAPLFVTVIFKAGLLSCVSCC